MTKPLAFALVLALLTAAGVAYANEPTAAELLAKAVPMPFPDNPVGGVADGPGRLIPYYSRDEVPTRLSPDDWVVMPTSGAPEKAGSGTPDAVEDTTEYPYSSVVQLVMQYGDYYAQCSGAFILDTHLIFTAGHCVYDAGSGGYAERIFVIPGKDGAGQPFGSKEAVNWASNEAWVNQEDYFHDWAIVEVEPFTQGTGRFNAVVESSNQWYLGRTFETAGYPADQGYTGDSMWWAQAPGVESGAYMMRAGFHYSDYPYYCIPGQSGSPIYWHNGDEFGIVAVLTLSDCEGVKMRSEILDVIKGYTCDGCILDGACYADGDQSPADSCVVCDAGGDSPAWTASYESECQDAPDPLEDAADDDGDDDDDDDGGCGC